MIFTDEKGKRWEFQGEVGYFTGIGWVATASCIIAIPDGGSVYGARVLPVPVTHTFGGVVFEETGETRPPQREEWFLDCEEVRCRNNSGHAYTYLILRPVRVEGQP